MAEEERRVDMVRVPREERYYEREAVFGRDVSSVFPSAAKTDADEAASLDADAIKEMLGARKFISESELETIRQTRSATVDDGAVAVDKPLAEILRERKDAKQAEFEAKWKLMKTGKNRPLDEDELQFLDTLAQQESAKEKAWGDMERAELEAFRAALRERNPAEEAAAAPSAAGVSREKDNVKPGPRPPTKAEGKASKPSFAPLIKVKARPAQQPAGAPPEAKRAKTDPAAEPQQRRPPSPRPEGLAGLLGAYSASDEGED